MALGTELTAGGLPACLPACHPVIQLVRFVRDQQGGVDGLHAGGAGEAAHEPVVDALGVVGVHAGQVAHPVAYAELDHADHAPGKKETSYI